MILNSAMILNLPLTYRLHERRDAVGLGGRGHPLELLQLLPRQRLDLRRREAAGALWSPIHGPARSGIRN